MLNVGYNAVRFGSRSSYNVICLLNTSIINIKFIVSCIRSRLLINWITSNILKISKSNLYIDIEVIKFYYILRRLVN
jgi:hypothetical protein